MAGLEQMFEIPGLFGHKGPGADDARVGEIPGTTQEEVGCGGNKIVFPFLFDKGLIKGLRLFSIVPAS